MFNTGVIRTRPLVARWRLALVTLGLTLSATFALSLGGPATAHAVDGITWAQVESESRLPGGDRVKVTYASHSDPNEVQFVFRRNWNLYWWKGLEIKDRGDNLVGFLERNTSGDTSLTLPYSEVDGGNLYLWKTGWFGLHIPAYGPLRLGDEARFPDSYRNLKGKRVTFSWVAEG